MYTIPAGTQVSIHNRLTGVRIDRYVTKKELTFDYPINTGYNGAVSYFVHGDWEICVNSNLVQCPDDFD